MFYEELGSNRWEIPSFPNSSEIVTSRLIHFGIDQVRRKQTWKFEMNTS